MQDVGVWIRAVAILSNCVKLLTFSVMLAAGVGIDPSFPFPGAAAFIASEIKGADTVREPSFSRHQLRQVLSKFEGILCYIQFLFSGLKPLNCKRNCTYIFTQTSWTFE